MTTNEARPAEKKRGRGRPRKPVEVRQVTELASIGCTVSEVAAVCGVSVDTINRNYTEALEKGREEGKSSLRRMQWKAAQAGNVAMLIWLGKNMLHQREPREDAPVDTAAILAAITKVQTNGSATVIPHANGSGGGNGAVQEYDA